MFRYFNTSFRKITLSSSIVFVFSGTSFSLSFTDGVPQFTGGGSDSFVPLGRMSALTENELFPLIDLFSVFIVIGLTVVFFL